MHSPPISFLIGSGFSKPAGYPLASEINQLFVDLKEGEISIHTDGTAWFNHGKPGPNDWFMRKDDRVFVEKLLAYYREMIISPSSFHYETFYDWYKDLLNGRKSDPGVDEIANDLGRGIGSLLLNFDYTFNQLLAQSLRRWPPEVSLGRGLPVTHAGFMSFIETLGEAHVLHFHSLNHDLFFESLSKSVVMEGNLSDGFSDLGSPYYGILQRIVEGPDESAPYSYRVRLPRFIDQFDGRFNLYKLHGGVDQYVFHDSERATFKSKLGIGTTDFEKETARDGELTYERDFGNYHPNFLSGTTHKTLQYDSTPYLKAVFGRFASNLGKSPVLVVIGYGFADAEINRFVKDCFLTDDSRRILVVDVVRPKLPEGIEESSQYFDGGVTNCDYDALLADVRSAI